MENLAQHDEWILKFFSKELSAKEATAFQQWINEDEANRKYVADLYAVWNLSQLKFTAGNNELEQAWLELSKKIAVLPDPTVGAELPGEMDIPTRRVMLFTLWKKIAVAAAVVLAISLALVYQTVTRKITETPRLAQTDTASGKAKERQLHHEINNSGKSRMVILPDGGSVRLYDKSELVYPETFNADKRTVLLTGRAYFKVAKDFSKPFIVTTNMLATTALGTEFEARAFKNEKRIVIRLYEGKVMVSSSLKSWKKDVYLAPGDELAYLLDKDIVKLNRFAKTPDSKLEEAEPSLPFDTKGTWYMFNNQSLEQVFEQLQELYGTKIIYSKKDVADMYFIGKFKKDDSLEVILKKICLVNGLKLTREGSQYQVSK